MPERISPELLAAVLGEPRPTPAQSAVISAPPGPRLIVAGAGAGKTATMVARAVYLVANGLVHPDQILGLTFTRKATQQLGRKMREAFAKLAADNEVTRGLNLERLANTQPTALTYDAYSGELLREYGLLIPAEPGLRIVSTTELHAITHRVVADYAGPVSDHTVGTVVEYLLDLAGQMNNHQVTEEQLREETAALLDNVENLPSKRASADGLNEKSRTALQTQELRLNYLPLLQRLTEELDRRGVSTFDRQMAQAARLAETVEQVGRSQRERYRVVMLDEYQDTSHSQRVLLRSLFGGGTDPELTVNAVGDPMQAIYGWRGATSANLAAFVDDFPTAEGQPAPKSELVTSFRNPPGVLAMANRVADTVLGVGDRMVSPLNSFDESKPQEIRLGWYDTNAEEEAAVADYFAEAYRRRDENGGFTGAILIRKNAQALPFAEALAERGVPYEIVGLSGLLNVPEVADLIALATMLVRPDDNVAAARILTGPMVGLSVRDLQRLAQRAKQLGNAAGRKGQEPSEPGESEIPQGEPQAELLDTPDPLERLKKIIEETVPAAPEEIIGLTDALADLSDRAGLSEEGQARAAKLSKMLGGLRRHSLAKPLTDLFADIERASGLRTEVLARSNPYGDGAVGTTHLDQLAEYVASYAAVPGATLPQLLDYFELARTSEKGLDRGEVAVQADRVQILTVHKAKGLEWDIVAVPKADSSTWTSKTSTYLTAIAQIPADLRGDAEFVDQLDLSEAEYRQDFSKACEAYKAEVKAEEAQEALRLFYVALTRSEHRLIVTGSAESSGQKPNEPYAPFEELADRFPEHIVSWAIGEETAADGADGTEDTQAEAEGALFPVTVNTPDIDAGARLVAEAMATLPPQADGELATTWEADVTALIEEHAASQAPVLDVVLPEELTTSDVVALSGDPEQFARRLRRPVPFKPNAYAKRGTAFHQWLEDRFGRASLLDEEDLPGNEEEPVTPAELEHLKARFLESPWADRTPVYVELPFELALGGRIIRGRMDAVFRDAATGEWEILDWKTGRPPTGEDRRTAELQLAVYQLALTELLARREAGAGHGGTAADAPAAAIRAGFHYVGWNETLWPSQLPGRDELARLLDG